MTSPDPSSPASATRGAAVPTPPQAGASWVPSIGMGVFALLAAQATALALGVWTGLDGTFTGADSYMRLTRVLECTGGLACPEGVLTRSNWPHGESLHWPWLWDWILLVLSAPLRLILDPATAVTSAAYIAGPLFGVLTVAAVTFTAMRWGIKEALPYVGLIAVTQPSFAFAFAYARPDHHGIQTAFFAAGLLGVASALTRPDGHGAKITGVALGTGIWISTEGLITALPLLAAVAVLWTTFGGREWTRVNRELAMWTTGTLLFGLLIDGPIRGPLSVEFDRLSIVHVVLFALITTLWATVAKGHNLLGASRGRRGLTVFLGGAIALLTMMVIFPGFERGPAAEIPEALWTTWLRYTDEYVPLIRRSDATEILGALTPFLIGLPLAAVAAMKSRGIERYLWCTIAVALCWFAGLTTFQQVRWKTYAQILTVLPLAWLLGRLLAWANALVSLRLRALARVLLVIGVVLGPQLGAAGIGLVLGRRSYEVVDQCEPSLVIEQLSSRRGARGEPATILAPIFWGPEILNRTQQRVVATPYHRNTQGILDSHRIMSADQDTAKRLIEARGITHIVTCPQLFWVPYVAPDSEGTLYGMLARGVAPEWLSPVSVPPPGIGLWEVLQP
ncbi:MAG: hypothetical protein ACR2QM_02760 [Longimicrobiales bacterium]